VYPPIAQQAKIQGAVVIEAIIDIDGKVREARVLRPLPMLDQAALDAVRQWEYEPTLLAGQPIAVVMTVTVTFTLK
jgi:protein TonB